MRQMSLAAAAWIVLLASLLSAQAPSPWQQPAAALAGKIADLLGPGQAHLTLNNMSSVPGGEVPSIQKLLADDLRARGITMAGTDSANSVRVTLSENATERLWVAQVIEGDETQVAMIDAGPVAAVPNQPVAGMVLRRESIFAAGQPVLAALAMQDNLVILEPQRIAIFARSPSGWQEQHHAEVVAGGPLARDPRGVLLPAASGHGFVAWLPGQNCMGSYLDGPSGRDWTMNCHASDDPWTIVSGASPRQPGVVAPALPTQLSNGQTNAMAAEAPGSTLKAFYNAARDYFTGTLVPNPAVDIPPFYAAASVSGIAGGEALLLGGIDGRVQLLDNGALSTVRGTHDWGSDFAALHSGCGSGTQMLVSGAGDAATDTLRAYDLPGLEAVPASEPLPVNGTVTALWTAPDGRGVLAVVRTAATRYEVDRVSATCN